MKISDQARHVAAFTLILVLTPVVAPVWLLGFIIIVARNAFWNGVLVANRFVDYIDEEDRRRR